MIEKEINSLQEYMQFIDLYKGQYYFRGQADVSWNVEPSIFRNNDALMQESSLLGLEGTSKVGDNAKEVLRLQHFSTATRLCDITVNPLVALYFVFDCDGKDDVPGCVYIYEKKNEIKFDSAEMGVLLSISAGELDTVSEIEDRLVRNGTPMKRADIENLITTNHLVEYSREFSWSNERAFLQGGTGIFFGFSIDGENIIPKGNLKVEELSGKVIIPSNSKQKIKAELEALGVNGKILYNRDKTREAKLEYSICEEQDTSKHLFAKVIVFVKISDIIFSQIEIEKITDDVWHKMKRKYGKDSRIFIYVYYDEEDKRIGNWILFTSLELKNLMEYKIKFNPRYYFRRMEHLNDEVSFKEIYESIEPIVQKCKNTFEMVEKWHSDFRGDTLSLEMYKRNLENAMKELLPLIFDKLQMISHGQKKYDDYYHSGTYFCESVDAVIRDQLIYIEQGENKQSLLFNYNFRIEKCKKYWREFEAAKRVHADDLTYFM